MGEKGVVATYLLELHEVTWPEEEGLCPALFLMGGSGEFFKDPEFPAEESSLGPLGSSVPAKKKRVVWIHATDLNRDMPEKLFDRIEAH